MNFDNLKAIAVSRGSRGVLVIQKYSPEILIAGGIVGVVTAGVLACRATLKASEVMVDREATMEMIHQCREESDLEKYPQENYQQDLIIVTVQTTLELVKLYLPAIIVGGISIGMLLQSRNILTRRNAGLLAAYKTLDEAYTKYRKRIREEFGEDVETYLRTRKPDEEHELVVKKLDQDGKESDFELSEEEGNMVDFGASQYAKFFDQNSPQWRPNNESNIFFLKAQQTNANVTLTTRGHLFLNEVYDMLGIPRTKAGAVVGWVKDHGDDVVDFGIFNSLNNYNDDYVNGYERQSILLDFNVDGWIWDLI